MASNVMGLGRAAPADAMMPTPVGMIAGIPVIIDNNISTTTRQRRGCRHDRASRPISFLFDQTAPMMLNFEQTAGTTLEVDLIGYEYYAFTSQVQPTGGATVRGNNLFDQTLTVT